MIESHALQNDCGYLDIICLERSLLVCDVVCKVFALQVKPIIFEASTVLSKKWSEGQVAYTSAEETEPEPYLGYSLSDNPACCERLV